jgi:hypothetical protein
MAEREPQSPEEINQPENEPIPKALFELGQIVVTPGAIEAAQEIGRHPVQFIARHAEGKWGDLPEEDVAENELSLERGYRLFSAYKFESGHKFYVITEWDRSVTTVLLPSEY